LILRRATPRRGAEGVWGERFSPRIGGFRGVAPPSQQSQHYPPGQHDETDDAAGHRIYLNPWAVGDQDEEVPVGLVEEYGDEP
ncbi:MAG: hypothetical protein WBF34_03750, partial [Streptosporangiaceae bacterium]